MGTRDREQVGLCRDCRHSRIVDSRTSRFWRCGLSDHDPRFPRYPRLPVLACDGYEPRDEGEASPGPESDPGR